MSTIRDELESIEVKSFKENFEATMLEMQKELDKTDKLVVKDGGQQC